MLRREPHRMVIALALAAALLATAAPLAAELNRPAHASWRLDLDVLQTWARLWLGVAEAPALPAPRKSACEGGLSIDPDGHAACRSQAGASSDGGLQIDPNG
jgi:hypothetical protein